jgi:adenine-specific DNA-methyltransferase
MMDKMKFESPDMTTENIEKIAALFPNCITEMRDENGKLKRGINFKMLKQMLSPDVVDGDECYEFTWVGKKAAIVEANKPIRKTLRPCPEESKNWETTENLYIEGDNLEVLKLLQESYLGKVKMIYIDPPYNTGNDFIYADDFMRSQEEENEQMGMYDEYENRLFKNTDTNGRFHSDWCSMMYSRLMLARNLLRDDGVILINMDENEITNLQKLCAEVFGVSNDLGTIVWDKRNPKGDAKGISYQHEYILVYSKNKAILTEKCKIQRPKKNADAILKKAAQLYANISDGYTLDDANADFAAWIRVQNDFSGGEKAYNKIDSNGDVYRPVSMAWPNKKKAPDDYFVPLIHPVTHKPCPVPERGWRNPSATMRRMQEEGLILFGKDESTIPNSKYLLKDNLYENIPSLLYYGGSDTELLSQMGIPFETPKVVSVCVEHIKSFTEDGDIVLDFFSGSATTAHAVMQLNAEDGGKRKFIMVQLPEPCDEKSEAYNAGYKNICEIGKERIRRAGEKIKSENPETLQHLDVGFRVFKLDDSNMKDVYYAADDYDQQKLVDMVSNIKEDRTDLDLLFGCLLDWGLPMSLPYKSEQIDGCTVHTYNDGDLIACFDQNIPESVVKEIAKRKPLRAVFRDSSFASSPSKINVFEIFKLYMPEDANDISKRVKVI